MILFRCFTTACALAATVLLADAMRPAMAAPERYVLDRAASTVAFEVDFGSNVIEGRMPVAEADILLDVDRPSQSRIGVSLDVTRARTGLFFATEAMKSPSVLNAAAHPRITFESTTLQLSGTTAEVDGIVTIRGVSRPVRLSAEFYRRAGTAEGDLSSLSIHIRARVSRSAFGATGYADLVGDEVRLLIVARIDRAD